LNVYGAVAAIGLASRTGWLELAPGLRGLQSPIVTGSAVLLFLIDIYADRSPRTQRWWGALHTIVRPLAASSLAAVALSAAPVQPPMWLWLAATFTTGIVALLVHASKTGARLLFSVSGERGRGRAVAWMEDALALALGPLILARPAETLWIAALIMVALGVFGRWLWRAFLLGPRALAALGAGFFGVRGSSYRSAIFPLNREQEQIARDTIADVDASGLWPAKAVTTIEAQGPFWEAEPEHQDYLERIPNGYTCHFPRAGWVLK
jgi:hypothetical protein